MGGAWLNGAESRIALERRRGAEGHTEADGRNGGGGKETRGAMGVLGRRRKRAQGEREKESCLGAIN